MNRGFAICPQPLSRLATTAPRPGSLLAFCYHHPKAVPVYGESGTKCRKGNGLEMLTAASYSPLSFAYAQQNAGWNMVVLQRCRLQYSLFRPILPSLHRPLGALGSNPPHAGTAFGWSYRQPALKGEVANEVRRRGYKEACSSLSVSTPQLRLMPCQLPVRGA